MGNSFFNPFMVGPDFASGVNDMIDSILYGRALGSGSGGNDMSDFYMMLNGFQTLAKGGIVNRPTYALIGEEGPEAIIPLSRGGQQNAGIGAGGVAQTFQNPIGGGQGGLSPQTMQLLLRWLNGGFGMPRRSY
jgi:phage-related minor tail protein